MPYGYKNDPRAKAMSPVAMRVAMKAIAAEMPPPVQGVIIEALRRLDIYQDAIKLIEVSLERKNEDL